jgi:hypothetical protein
MIEANMFEDWNLEGSRDRVESLSDITKVQLPIGELNHFEVFMDIQST